MSNNNVTKMFANFKKNIFLPLEGRLAEPENIFAHLRNVGEKISLSSVKDILTGKKEVVSGYELVNITGRHGAPAAAKRVEGLAEVITPDQVQPTEKAAQATEKAITKAKGGQAPKTPEQIKSQTNHMTVVVNTQTPAKGEGNGKGKVSVPNLKAVTSHTTSKEAPAKGSQRGKVQPVKAKEVEVKPATTPAGIKPVKRGTKVAAVMEMLLEGDGHTIEEMRDALGWKTNGGVASVVHYYPKFHGYGVERDKESKRYKLILPKGVKGIVYMD